MQKLISILAAAMFAAVTLNAVAADKGKGDEKKTEATAKKADAKKAAATAKKADAKKAAATAKKADAKKADKAK